MKWTVSTCALVLALGALGADAQQASMTISGQYSPSIQLSAGTPAAGGGRTASITAGGSGGSAAAPPVDATNFAAIVDFGDLSRGDGSPVVASVGLRIRSNTSYRLVTAVTNYQAVSLRYQGRDVGSDDGGSFIKVWTGAPSASGSGSSGLSRLNVNPGLSAGTTLSTISRGAASLNSTLIMSGPAASLEGSLQSASNGIDIPLFLSAPTGYELGPAPSGSQGTFSFSMQFAAFPGP